MSYAKDDADELRDLTNSLYRLINELREDGKIESDACDELYRFNHQFMALSHQIRDRG